MDLKVQKVEPHFLSSPRLENLDGMARAAAGAEVRSPGRPGSTADGATTDWVQGLGIDSNHPFPTFRLAATKGFYNMLI